MRRKKNIAGRYNHDERGIVIVLVAVMMLFVVGAMAALSIDVVTLYTARSEAQLAADAAALAGARVLANSGATSDSTGTLMPLAQLTATAVATQVAEQNQVGGVNLTGTEILPPVYGPTNSNPTITVTIRVTGLPAFFARIWGNAQFTVGATATAEAYNPSGQGAVTVVGQTPVAPICVKPWLLPNMDPSVGGNPPIFDPTTGAILTNTLLGWSSNTTGGVAMTLACNGVNGTCTAPLPIPPLQAWSYFPGDETTFPHPTISQPSCTPALTTNYQESIAGCIQIPISCSSPVGLPAKIDTNSYPGSGRNSDTTDAVNCLTHATTGGGDTVTPSVPLTTPFQFVAGTDNPLVLAGLRAGADIIVSDSLVTVPVFDVNGYNSGAGTAPIIGFVQLFLNPDGNVAPPSGAIKTTVINLAGCGTLAGTGTPIVGNGASPVAVRLISP